MGRFIIDKAPTPIPDIGWEQCIAKTDENGKPGISVLDHCRNVGTVARALVKTLPTYVTELLGDNPSLIAAFHDIGKISPGFQKKYFNQYLAKIAPELRRLSGGFESRHAFISEAALNAYFNVKFGTAIWAAVVGAHHGDRDNSAPFHDMEGRFGGKSWSRQRGRLIEALIAEFGSIPTSVPASAADILAGLVCVADWIGSDETYFPASGLPNGTDLDRQAEEAVRQCGWEANELIEGLSFEEIFDYSPYKMQEQFCSAIGGRGLYVLEAPMGMGKTEAALYAAYKLMERGHNTGLYFGLPTRLTSDKIHERVTFFLERISKRPLGVKLAHGQAWSRVFQHGGADFGPGKSWFNPRKRSLLYPFAVGTIDQALLSILRVRHFFVRLFGLAGKVVILDEVHSYDVYTGTLLEKLVERLLEINCTVIILSATLTESRRNKFFHSSTTIPSLNTYPLISRQVKGKAEALPASAPPSRTIEVRLKASTDNQVADLAVLKAKSGHCVLCISNTVARAQEWYNAIKATMSVNSFKIGLLHSKFVAWRRNELENEWIDGLGKSGNRPEGCVLVATQIVEQSVDIDSDFMISELAPTDMLLQRLGRLWRHTRRDRPCPKPEAVIITQDLDGVTTAEEFIETAGKANCMVYAPYVLWRSYLVWSLSDKLKLPSDVRSLLERTYRPFEGDEPLFAQELLRLLEKRKDKLTSQALSAQAGVEGLLTTADNESAVTRYSDLQMTDAILARKVDGCGNTPNLVLLDDQKVELDAFSKDLETTAHLYRNIISIPTYRLPGLKTPPYLRKHFYAPTALLLLDDSGELFLAGASTGLKYDNERGLYRFDESVAGTSSNVPFSGTTYSDFDEIDMEDFINESRW